MPLLGALIQGLFGGIAAWLAQYIGKKAAIATAAILAFSALAGGLFALTMVTINTLVPSLPGGQYIQIALWLAVPDTGPAVISACLSTDAAIAVYRWNKTNLNLAAVS